MVLFDQLRVSDDGKILFINAHVNKAEQFKNRYIKSITVLTADKVSETNPWNTSEDAPYIYRKTYPEGTKEIDLVITPAMTTEQFNKTTFSLDLFFVYVEMGGTPEECLPCELTTDYTLGVTFDTTLMYQDVMQYTRELAEDCTIPHGFIDYILNWNGFKSAIETEHYIPAIQYWNRLMGGDGIGKANTYKTKSCGCR